MAATVIAQAGDDPASHAVAWRQLVDLAAQNRTDAAIPGTVFHHLETWRADTPLDVRQRTARALVGLPIAPELFALFARDALSVAAPLAGTIHLTADQWRALLPALPPPVRGLLRHRRDLDADTRRALESFGPSDFVLEAASDAASTRSAPPLPDPLNGGVAIKALVERIESYRREHPLQPVSRAEPEPLEIAAERAERFRFETSADGLIAWVEGVRREALIGQSIALAAETPDDGVDGQAAGAFRRRAAFREARLTVPGKGPAAGEWRLSAVPCFTPSDGRFTGYRGAARRPRRDEAAETLARSGQLGGVVPGDGLRALIHELRTPLNAILGFSEMIDGEILGPAKTDYRTHAATIAAEARRLLSTLKDLDSAASLGDEPIAIAGETDLAALLRAVAADLSPLSDARGAHLRVDLGESRAIALAPAAAERLVSRLLAAVLGVTVPGETLDVRLSADRGEVSLSIDRPRSLIGVEERLLLDLSRADLESPDAPLLGLGFSLRLVRNLAQAARGRLDILPERFALLLPEAGKRAGQGRGLSAGPPLR